MSHVSKRLFQHGGDRVGPTLNAVSPDKKSASVRQAVDKNQFFNKNLASLWQP